MERKPYELQYSDFIPIMGMFGYNKRVRKYRPDFITEHEEWCKKQERSIANIFLLVAYNNAIPIAIFAGLEFLVK